MPEAPNISSNNQEKFLDDKNKQVLQFIEDVTNNAGEVQNKVINEILSRNAGVEYLQRYGFNGKIDHETFKKTIPIVTYDDLKQDIDRIANGDNSPILCSEPISEFLTRLVHLQLI